MNHHIHRRAKLPSKLPMFTDDLHSIAQLEYEYTMAKDLAACASRNYETELRKLESLSLRDFWNKVSS